MREKKRNIPIPRIPDKLPILSGIRIENGKEKLLLMSAARDANFIHWAVPKIWPGNGLVAESSNDALYVIDLNTSDGVIRTTKPRIRINRHSTDFFFW